MEELKRCPFCGGMAHIKYDPDEVEEGSEKVWVYTVECGACAASSGLCYSKEQAIEVWNRRDVRDAIMREPTAEPQTAEWVNVRDGNIADCGRCNARGRAWMNFCPICGADMRGEQNG